MPLAQTKENKMPRKEKKGSASKAVASTKPKSPSVIEELKRLFPFTYKDKIK